MNCFQQFDFDLGQQHMATSVSLVRKFPRFYVAVSVIVDQSTNDVGVMLTIWPEGIPEATVGSRQSVLSSMTTGGGE